MMTVKKETRLILWNFSLLSNTSRYGYTLSAINLQMPTERGYFLFPFFV